MKTTKQITKDQVIELLPKTTSLIYVDYTDSLDEHHDLIQKCIHEGNFNCLYEAINDWYSDSQFDGIWDYMNDLRTKLENQFGLTEEEVEEIIDEYEDEIKDEIYSRCDDDTLKDLIRNTSNPIAHYDTGYEIPFETWNLTEAELRLERIKLKKFLQIKTSSYDSDLDMMISQSNGGSLLIYFKLDINDFINNENKDFKSIKFTNAHIGIIDHYQGGGDITELHGHEFILPYGKENVFLEKTIKYNWTYEIAGMCHDWCDSTEYEFSFENVGEVEKSNTNNLLEQEEKYNQVYKNGECSTGDMDINRHRNTEYINNYPCGTKCKDCGTFWID